MCHQRNTVKLDGLTARSPSTLYAIKKHNIANSRLCAFYKVTVVLVAVPPGVVMWILQTLDI